MLTGSGQLVGLGKVRGTRTIGHDNRCSGYRMRTDPSLFLPNFTPDTNFTQVGNSTEPTQITKDFVVQPRTICDSTLHAYHSRTADTAEKRHDLHISCTAAGGYGLQAFHFPANPKKRMETFETFLEDTQSFRSSRRRSPTARPLRLYETVGHYCGAIYRVLDQIQNEAENSIMTSGCGVESSRLVT